MKLNWESLLSESRLIRTASGELSVYVRTEEAPRTAAEADVQRIIFSSPFRRLAGKTQVHPFARVDYVHNRLTHSLEVAETGTALTQAVMRNLGLAQRIQHAAALHVRAACLGHDIGNPPYGHVGESVIQAWGRKRETELRSLFARKGASETEAAALIRDLQSFDGNAQTFRLLSHPMPREGAHFRLTCATLGTAVKYPYPSSEAAAEKKYSVFFSFREEFETVWRELGLRPGERHPLSYILEIADDICYCVTDCEDALLMNILQPQTVREWFLNLFDDSQAAAGFRTLPISHLRAKVIHHLLSSFAKELVEAFLHPERLAAFEETSPTWQRLKRLKSDYKIVFTDPKKLEKEAKIIRDLNTTLDRCFDSLLQTGSCVIPASERESALPHPTSAQETLHLFLDWVTGMSDASLHHFVQEA